MMIMTLFLLPAKQLTYCFFIHRFNNAILLHYSNSADNLLIKYSIETGLWIKHPKLTFGYTSLNASIFASPAVMKQTLTLTSNSSIFWENRKPFISGRLMSVSSR